MSTYIYPTLWFMFGSVIALMIGGLVANRLARPLINKGCLWAAAGMFLLTIGYGLSPAPPAAVIDLLSVCSADVACRDVLEELTEPEGGVKEINRFQLANARYHLLRLTYLEQQ